MIDHLFVQYVCLWLLVQLSDEQLPASKITMKNENSTAQLSNDGMKKNTTGPFLVRSL